MYTITLEVNQICNLRCVYCYLGEKTNQKMSEEVAYKGLEIAFFNAEKHKDRKLWVDFVGGEALLSFPFLQKLVEYIEAEAKNRNISVFYSITTNGTIMDDTILEWLIKNRVQLKLSIDGNRETHDRNRKTISGEGSYFKIKENQQYFREYEERTKKYIQAAHVVTQNNFREAFDSVQYLVENWGFQIVDSSVDVSHRWTKEQLDRLGEEWEHILCYYLKRREAGKEFLWGPVLDLKKYGEQTDKTGFCGVGLIQMYVKTNGRIYGCAANLNESGILGNVEKGFSVDRIKEYRSIFRKMDYCIECDVREKCQSRKCIMNNLAYSGKIDIYNPDMCYLEQKKIRIWEEYRNRIS